MTTRRWGLIAIGLVAFLVFFALAPGLVERGQNRIAGPPLPAVRTDARELHRDLVVADLHADTLLWKRDMAAASSRGHVDLPRLIRGNVALQVFSAVTKVPFGQNYESNGDGIGPIGLLAFAQMQPVGTWFSPFRRALYQSEKLGRSEAEATGRLRIVRTPGDLDRLLSDRERGTQVVGALLSIEGMHVLGDDIERLGLLYGAGYRIGGLTHFFDNDVAGSMHGEGKDGLTPLGRTVVQRMEAIGMVVDLAHASHKTIADVLAIATRPVIFSHGGVQATCAVNRNLTDAEIRGIADTGGVIGIGYWDGAVCATDPKAIAEAIAHVRDVGGIDHVGLGSDFDGAVTTAFDAGQLVQVTQALIDRGFTPAEIRKVMGGNVLRVLREGISPKSH